MTPSQRRILIARWTRRRQWQRDTKAEGEAALVMLPCEYGQRITRKALENSATSHNVSVLAEQPSRGNSASPAELPKSTNLKGPPEGTSAREARSSRTNR